MLLPVMNVGSWDAFELICKQNVWRHWVQRGEVRSDGVLRSDGWDIGEKHVVGSTQRFSSRQSFMVHMTQIMSNQYDES